MQIDTDAAHARTVKLLQIGLRIRDGDAARASAEALQRVQGAGVVGAVRAWLNDDHPLDAEGGVQRNQIVD
jgi:hypothetical protein